MDVLAQKLDMDPADLRIKNFIKQEQFPYQSALGWEYDSGDYHTAMKKAMDTIGYRSCARNKRPSRKPSSAAKPARSWASASRSSPRSSAPGPSKNCDILGVAMFDSAEIRVHPTGSVIARMGTKSQGQGHETTYAQIIATEIGIPADDIMIEEGNTDTAPYGLGTYGSRSTPVAGAATPWLPARSATRPR
jgi:carbon-monoxide dehydrogenase large subunit